jgi:endonuclease III
MGASLFTGDRCIMPDRVIRQGMPPGRGCAGAAVHTSPDGPDPLARRDAASVGSAPLERGENAMTRLDEILDTLEAFHGRQSPGWPTDPYLFLVWWHCGYPPSEERCTAGWRALTAAIGSTAAQLLRATRARLARALKTGGLVPELRAQRLQAIARAVQDAFGSDLHGVLAKRPESAARKILKSFPGIGNPGADRILLFSAIAPVAAVPSSCPHVAPRLDRGPEPAAYPATYAHAQRLLEAQLPATFAARTRAYLLLQVHGQRLCRRTRPRCGECPVSGVCAYFARQARAGTTRPRRSRRAPA